MRLPHPPCALHLQVLSSVLTASSDSLEGALADTGFAHASVGALLDRTKGLIDSAQRRELVRLQQAAFCRCDGGVGEGRALCKANQPSRVLAAVAAPAAQQHCCCRRPRRVPWPHAALPGGCRAGLHKEWEAQNISRVAFGNASLFVYGDNVSVADGREGEHGGTRLSARCCSRRCWEPSQSGAWLLGSAELCGALHVPAGHCKQQPAGRGAQLGR
jgi:hypothetical protein